MKRQGKTTRQILLVLLISAAVLFPGVPAAAADLTVCGDSLGSGWANWSWSTTVNSGATAPVHSGSKSLGVTYSEAWAGLYLAAGRGLEGSSYDTLHDDISFTSQGVGPQSSLSGVGPPLSIDVSANRHSISEDIYGMNYADEDLAKSLRLPVRRWGGNSTTRYNWQANIHNTGSDWYFENIPDGPAVADGSASDEFVEQDRRTGTKTLLTVPLIGWTPSGNSPRNHPYDCGYKVSKYGAQQSTDPWDTDCGNGVSSSGSNITGNAPSDTSTRIGPDFVTDWVHHLTAKYGFAQGGGVACYNLDNEPMLWNSTHRDVHPQPATYDELRDRTVLYASAVKAADPTAKTLGPALWGWCAYFYSALDGCGEGDDYRNHGNLPFVAWYLQQMRAHEQSRGVRILDYLDLHYYPQANGVALSSAGDAETRARRLRSTRSLWDPSYIDESWISDMASGGVAVRLIPRMKEWVKSNYPGTKLAITEYNWGALDHINGALAQADVLGIFGREGLHLATLWGPPALSDPGAFAFRMYRNYDGNGKCFGNVSTKAVSGNQSKLSVYAAQRSSDRALTVMVINKTSGALTSTIDLAGFAPQSAAAVYRYSSSQPDAIQRASNIAVSGTSLSADFPGYSITLLVLRPASTPPPPVVVSISPTSASLPAGKSRQFTVGVSGTANTSVTWKVNGVTGGNTALGTISSSGLYKAPGTVPDPAVVTISATSKADTTKSASAKVKITPLQVYSPNGGEVLTSGGTFTIKWAAASAATAFRLRYSLDNGKSWLSVVSGKVTGKSYQWKVPAVASNKTECLVKVTGYDTGGHATGTDQSNRVFTIAK
ncbi:MAG: glycoside hydrolase family 44 protein [Syntrophobacteraceae bacterium]